MTLEHEEINPEAAQRLFHDHLSQRATSARLAYGLCIDAEAIVAMLDDRNVVRYPTTLHFDATTLEPHEFGYARAVGFHPSDGFALLIHPAFRDQPEHLPLVIAYHIPVINYPTIIDTEGAERFGAVLLGLEVDAYRSALCVLADGIGAVPMYVSSE